MDTLSDVKEEIRQLHDRSQGTKTALKVLEATSSERHASIIEKIEKLNYDLEKVNTDLEKLNQKISVELGTLSKNIAELHTLALQGKTSLKTLWALGGIFAATLAVIASWMDIFKL